MKVNVRLKFFLSLMGIAGIACIAPFASSYSTQTNNINFKTDSVSAPQPSALAAVTDVSQFGVGVVPTGKNMMATDKDNQFFHPELQETPLQFGYTESAWGNSATGNKFPLALPGAASGLGPAYLPNLGTSSDAYTSDDAVTFGNPYPPPTMVTPHRYVNGASWTPATAKIVDMTPVTELDYTGAKKDANNDIFMKNPVLGAYNIASHTYITEADNAMWAGNDIPDGDTDLGTYTYATYSVPGDWPNSSSYAFDRPVVGYRNTTAGTNSLNLSLPAFPYHVADGKDATCYDDFKKFSPLNSGEIFPTQLDFLSEDTLNYAARSNAMAGFTNPTADAANILKAEAANFNAPVFYKPTDGSTILRSRPTDYNTLRSVDTVKITDASKQLSEIGFNCFGGQYRYTGYYGTANQAPYFNGNYKNAKLQHSFTSPLAGTTADLHGYDIPDAFTHLGNISINVSSLKRIHTGAFYGGITTEDYTTHNRVDGRPSLTSIDLTGSPITYMDDFDGKSKVDTDTTYWSTHCPDPDFSTTSTETDPKYIGGVFENNPNLTNVTFEGSVDSNTLLDIPSHCFSGDKAMTGIKYSKDSKNGTPKGTITSQLPNSVKYIGAEPWKNSGWNYVVLPNNSALTMDADFLGGLENDTGPKTITFTTKGMTTDQIGKMTDWSKALYQGGKKPDGTAIPPQTYNFTIPYEGKQDISLSPYYVYFKTLLKTNAKINIQYALPTYKITGTHHNISPDSLENTSAHVGTNFFTINSQQDDDKNVVGDPYYLQSLVPQFCDASGKSMNSPKGWTLSAPTKDSNPYFSITAAAGADQIDPSNPVYVRAIFKSDTFFQPDSTLFEELAVSGSWKDSPGFSQQFWSAGTPQATSSSTKTITFNNSYTDGETFTPITPSIKSPGSGVPPNDGHWQAQGINGLFTPTDGSDPIPFDGFPSPAKVSDTHTSFTTNLSIGIDPNRSTNTQAGTYSFNVQWIYTEDTSILPILDKTLYTLYCWSTTSLTLASTVTSQSIYLTTEQLDTGYDVPSSLQYTPAKPTITFAVPSGSKVPPNSSEIGYGVELKKDSSTWDSDGKWLKYGPVDGTDPKSFSFSFDTTKQFTRADVGSYTFTITPHPTNFNQGLKTEPLTFSFTIFELTTFQWGSQGSVAWNTDTNANVRQYNNTAYNGTDLVWDTKSINNPTIYPDTKFDVTAQDQTGRTVDLKKEFGIVLTNTSGQLTITWKTTTIAEGSYTFYLKATNDAWQGKELDDSFVFNVWKLTGGDLLGGPDAFLKGKYFSSGVDSSDVPGLADSLLQYGYTTNLALVGSTGSDGYDPFQSDITVAYSLTQSPFAPAFNIDSSQATLENNFLSALHWNSSIPNPFTESLSYTPTIKIDSPFQHFTNTQKKPTSVSFVDSSTATIDDSKARDAWNAAGEYHYSGQQLPDLNFKALVGENHDITADSTWTLDDTTDYTDVPGQVELLDFADLVKTGSNAGTVTFKNIPDLTVGTSQKYTFHMSYVYNNDSNINASEDDQGSSKSYTFNLFVDTAGIFTTDWTDNMFRTVDNQPTVFAQTGSHQTNALWHIHAPSGETPDPNIVKYAYAIYGENNKLISYFGTIPNGYTPTPAFADGISSGLVITNALRSPDDEQNAFLQNNGINAFDPTWTQFFEKNNPGRMGFKIQVLAMNADNDQIASSLNPNLSYINLSQITSLNKVKFKSTKYAINLNDTKISQTDAPTYEIGYDKTLAPLSADRTKPSFFISASSNSNDISNDLRIIKNGVEVTEDTMKTKYSKLSIYQSDTFDDSTNYGKINFGFNSKLSSDEKKLYSGTWMVYSNLYYQKYISGSTIPNLLSVQSNGIEFDLTPPSHTGIVVGLIVAGISGTIIVALVLHAIIKTSKIKKIEREDAEEEKAARSRISGPMAPTQTPSSSTGF